MLALVTMWGVLALVVRTATGPTLQLSPCTPLEGAPKEARCGTLSVPENWDQPAGRSIGLQVVVVPAAHPRAGGVPMFELAGGPGLGIIDWASQLLRDGSADSAYRQHREVVLVDQRGTGRSSPLRCPELEAQGPLREMYPLELVRACRDRLAARADLRQYTTASSARDVDAVRAALGYERIDLEGLSYGTVLAQTYLRLFPDRVRSVVLLSAAAPDAKMPLGHAQAAQRALDRVFEKCAADAACASAYPRLNRDWTEVLDRLAQGPIHVPRAREKGDAKGIEIRRDVFGEAFRGILGTKPWDVPFVIHRMAEGDFTPFLDRLSLDGLSPFAEGLYLSLVCAEGTSRITDEEAAMEAQGNFLGGYRVSEQRRACGEWPHAEPSLLEAPRSSAPVLFMNGTADYVTPPEVAERLARRLTRSRVVLIEGLPHFPAGLSHMECYFGLVNAFFENPDAARLDTSCIATMKPPPFRTAPDPR